MTVHDGPEYALVGLVSKNGVLIVQFANHLQELGRDKLAAIIEAAGTRLRPILMTTAATVMGHFPLIIATGPGAGARNSIGIMLVSGMIISSIFTLFVVPSIYMLVAKKHVLIAFGSDRASETRPADASAPAGTSFDGSARGSKCMRATLIATVLTACLVSRLCHWPALRSP